MSEDVVTLPPELDDALAAIDQYSDTPIEERFDALMERVIAFGWFIMDRQKKTGKRIESHEREWQEDAMVQLRMIDKVFTMARKNGRMMAKANEQFDTQLINTMRDMKSSVGEIVQRLPDEPK